MAAADRSNIMTQAAYARRRGVTRETVGKWKARGQIVIVQNDAGRDRVDAAQSDALLGALQNPLKISDSAAPSPAEISDDGAMGGGATAAQASPPAYIDPAAAQAKRSRAAKETADAAMSQLKYRQMSAELIPREEVAGIGPACAALLHQSLDTRRLAMVRKIMACENEREALAAARSFDDRVLSQYADSLLAFDALASGADAANPLGQTG